MGVQGLKTFIESKHNFLQERQFRNSKLVIDGSNLYYSLYFDCGLDQVHGGEYDAFEKELRLFFTAIKDCDIEPYVVIDGGSDYTDKKIDTLLSRAKERIKRASQLSRGRSRQIIPPLSKNVFEQYLWENKVPFVQCVAEADWEAAALANEWNCPILSNDSDFYIFNIRGGVLPLSQFEWKKTVVSKKQKKSIPAKWFQVKSLCLVYNNMNKDLLPICAAILGNDYTKLDKAKQFPDWRTFSTGPEEHKNIDGLLTWLSRFRSPKKAILGLMNFMKNKVDSDEVSTKVTASIKEYRLTSSSIAQFFESGSPPSNLPCPLQKMPAWMLQRLMKGELSSIIIDVLVLNRIILNFMVEDSKLRSSNLTSRPIRQVIYGLVLGGQPRPGSSASDDREYMVEEYDREELELTISRVAAIFPGDEKQCLYPETLHEASKDLRLQTLLDALQVSHTEEPPQVPAHLQLLVYITCYWMKNAHPEPKPEFLWALLVGLVFGEMSRNRRTAKEVGPVFKRLRNIQTRKGWNQLDQQVAHTYNQWQRCVRDSFCLNQLLSNPVPEPQCAWLYNGPLVHRVVSLLKKGTDPESLLTGGPFPLQLFRKLCSAVEAQLQARPCWCNVYVDDLCKKFDLTGIEEEEDDKDLARKGKKGNKNAKNQEDAIYDMTSSVRTRHKIKRRVRPGDDRAKKYERLSWGS